MTCLKNSHSLMNDIFTTGATRHCTQMMSGSRRDRPVTVGQRPLGTSESANLLSLLSYSTVPPAHAIIAGLSEHQLVMFPTKKIKVLIGKSINPGAQSHFFPCWNIVFQYIPCFVKVNEYFRTFPIFKFRIFHNIFYKSEFFWECNDLSPSYLVLLEDKPTPSQGIRPRMEINDMHSLFNTNDSGPCMISTLCFVR